MGSDFRVTFADLGWYARSQPRIVAQVGALPCFVGAISAEEFWLKDPSATGSWAYDLRVFARPEHLQIEVSVATSYLYVELRRVLDWIRLETSVEVLDEDGVPLSI